MMIKWANFKSESFKALFLVRPPILYTYEPPSSKSTQTKLTFTVRHVKALKHIFFAQNRIVNCPEASTIFLISLS